MDLAVCYCQHSIQTGIEELKNFVGRKLHSVYWQMLPWCSSSLVGQVQNESMISKYYYVPTDCTIAITLQCYSLHKLFSHKLAMNGQILIKFNQYKIFK